MHVALCGTQHLLLVPIRTPVGTGIGAYYSYPGRSLPVHVHVHVYALNAGITRRQSNQRLSQWALTGAGVSFLGVSFSIRNAICRMIPRISEQVCNCVFAYCSQCCVTSVISRCGIALPAATETLITVPVSGNSNDPAHPGHS